MDDIVVAETYGTAFEAEIAVAHLESVGIKASVSTDNAGGALPSLTSLAGGARLVVASDDLERTQRVLTEFTNDG